MSISQRLWTTPTFPIWLFSPPSHRGQGYGTALLQKAEEFARQRGMTMLKIQVLVKNQQATSVYLHAGFRPYELALLKPLE